jgi:hypothetical protein
MLCSFVTSIMVPLCPWNNSLEGAYLKFSLSEFEVLSLHSYSNPLNKFNRVWPPSLSSFSLCGLEVAQKPHEN